MIMQLVVLFQVKIGPFVHEDDNTIADVHDDTSKNGDLISMLIFLFRLVYYDGNTIVISRIVVLYQDVHEHDDIIYQIKYKMIRPFHLIYDNDVDATIIAILQLVIVVLHQHAHVGAHADNGDNDTLNMNVLVVLYQNVHVKDDTIAFMQLVVLYQVKNEERLLLLLLQVQVMVQVKDQDDTLTVKDTSDSKENNNRTTRYSNENPYMIQYHDIITVIDATLQVSHFNENRINTRNNFKSNNSNRSYDNNDDTVK
ncbi:hypothetical protein FRACYDRAFT_258701 [Fragilariopsis cylindrus CCMP1102]|uniref:Uncharacterized protein n=1 Tax=Fragilariopsis cylindrus CCMP1102 TaxID=635003 RepID=A0A1E7EJ78_9STRA|nr:hypothetical protein FRACYDRAFT_258701 [Fragilariopsis cylindrus CCMP1102]|eukprot:OEU05673.1 hypothetical protein FRACYDRAFT_258701 [Fragilariopsis cylindrus CCMP1102]